MPRLSLIVATGTLAALLAAPALLQAQRPTTLAGRSTVYAPQRRRRHQPAARLRGRVWRSCVRAATPSTPRSPRPPC